MGTAYCIVGGLVSSTPRSSTKSRYSHSTDNKIKAPSPEHCICASDQNKWSLFGGFSCVSCMLFDFLNNAKDCCSPHVSVAGVMVSIIAFQAMDLGSIPGRRAFIFILHTDFFVCVKNPHLARNSNNSSENL